MSRCNAVIEVTRFFEMMTRGRGTQRERQTICTLNLTPIWHIFTFSFYFLIFSIFVFGMRSQFEYERTHDGPYTQATKKGLHEKWQAKRFTSDIINIPRFLLVHSKKKNAQHTWQTVMPSVSFTWDMPLLLKKNFGVDCGMSGMHWIHIQIVPFSYRVCLSHTYTHLTAVPWKLVRKICSLCVHRHLDWIACMLNWCRNEAPGQTVRSTDESKRVWDGGKKCENNEFVTHCYFRVVHFPCVYLSGTHKHTNSLMCNIQMNENSAKECKVVMHGTPQFPLSMYKTYFSIIMLLISGKIISSVEHGRTKVHIDTFYECV